MSFSNDICFFKSFKSQTSAKSNEINDAENKLNLHFSTEYKEYLSLHGCASIYGHEFTGIGFSERTDVVTVTLEERERHTVPNDWYVVEQAHIDGIVIWQSSEGSIYQTTPENSAVKLCDSLARYIELY